MTHQSYRVTFQPDGRSVFVLGGTKAVEAAGQAGIIINQPCGGEGTCGKCRVEVSQNPPEPTSADRRAFSDEQLEAGWRLACQLIIHDDMVISVPQEARFFEQMVLTEGREATYSLEPNVRKVHVTVPEATETDQRSDVDRLRDAVGEPELEADLDLVRALPGLLRRADHSVTAVLEGSALQWVEPGDTTCCAWGVAFDIGTTTLVGTLMDLQTGRSHAVASRTNPQVHFGDDVVSRIAYAEKHREGLHRLRKRLLTALNEIVIELCSSMDVEPEHIYEATAVGNTTMAHIFLGVDPTPIAHAPYVAVFRESMDVKAREVGLEINPNANLHMLPNMAGFVGSDTVGVVLASGMHASDRVCLAIDIGTNGEVVLGNRERMLSCSCAAGPALEGARIRHGMRAAEGAISKIVINDDLETSVIGGGRPTGLCGSALIDAIALFLEHGLINPMGKLVSADDAGDLPENLRGRLVTVDEQPAVVLAHAHESKTGDDIVLTQKDVREVQLASAAIRAGILVLLDRFEIAPEDLDAVLLAGGFGNFIRRSHAKRMGLLPAVRTDRIEFIGNAAATGAKAALASVSCRTEAEAISRETEYIELAASPEFQTYYMDAMLFPEE